MGKNGLIIKIIITSNIFIYANPPMCALILNEGWIKPFMPVDRIGMTCYFSDIILMQESFFTYTYKSKCNWQILLQILSKFISYSKII